MTNPAKPSEQWYDKTWLVIFLCVFVFPVGLYALWKSAKISKNWKFAGTAIVGLLVIIVVAGKPAETDQSAPSATSSVESKPATTSIAAEKPAANDNAAFQDSLIAVLKKDSTYKVSQVAIRNGIIQIAVSNADPDVIGHFNIMYDLHIARVPFRHEDSVFMMTKGIFGIAIYNNTIDESRLFNDMIWKRN
jgi:hypothetical protein